MCPTDNLQGFQPQHRFLIGIDSDGCVFDSMRTKHLDAFIPAALATWDLGPLGACFAEDELEVNLRSAHRGINRFAGLLLTFERFSRRPEAQHLRRPLPDLEVLREFVQSDLPQSAAGLREFIRHRPSPTAVQVLAWSQRADERFSRAAESAIVFAEAATALEKASAVADLMIVSAASTAGLWRDWERAGLLRFMSLVAGQDAGDKRTQLTRASQGRYRPDRVLLIGDSPGDLTAAQAAGALFYPIVPDQEPASWRRFHEIVLDQFTSERYGGPSEASAISGFRRALRLDAD